MINLTITEERFDELYPDLTGMYDHFDQPPPHDIEPRAFEKLYLSSKLWRLNNIYTVINKDGKPVTFRMNEAQHIVYAASRQHSRLIILKSRQQGISTLWLLSYFDDGMFAPFFTIGLMAQGTDEASTLLERVKFTWNMLDPSVKKFAGVRLDKDNSKEFSFSNGSSLFIRVSFRSATLQRLHISEFGKIANANPQRAKETKTGSLQALAKGNTGVIESTAEGRNEFKNMWDTAVIVESSGNQLAPKDFKPVFLSWLDDPDCTLDLDQAEDQEAAEYFKEVEEQTKRKIRREQRNFWISQRRELGGDIFQEYPATPEEAFAASRDGTYFSKLFNEYCVRRNRIVTDLYDPNLDTDIYFDLGVDDYTVMLWVQWYRKDFRIVREYWNNGFDLEYYVDHAIDVVKLPVRTYAFPHDINVRELTSGNSSGGRARTRKDVVSAYLRKRGSTANVKQLPKIGIADGIENTRKMIHNLYIDSSCSYTIDCLLNYSKEWDPKLQVWKKTPLHDEYSHGADALRQVASAHPGVGASKMAIPERRRIGKNDFAV